MFFDVSFKRDESLMNKVRDFLIRVRLSFQLSACASSGCRGKIDQEWFVFNFGLRQSCIDVAYPVNEHSSPPGCDDIISAI